MSFNNGDPYHVAVGGEWGVGLFCRRQLPAPEKKRVADGVHVGDDVVDGFATKWGFIRSDNQDLVIIGPVEKPSSLVLPSDVEPEPVAA